MNTRILAVVLLSVVGFSTVLACNPATPPDHPTAMFRGDPSHSGTFQTEGVERLGGVLWRLSTHGPVRSSPTVTEESVYVGSTDGNLYALDRGNGEIRWQYDAGSPVSSSPAVTLGMVVFGSTDGTFHGVNSHSGASAWRFQTGPLLPWEWGFEGWDIYTSSPVVVDSTVVFGSGDGVVYALNVRRGTELWRFLTDGRIRSTPAVADGVVFIGSTDGIVYALELEDGEERWRHETDGAGMVSGDLGVDRKSIISSASVVDGTVFIGSRDGFMYALDQETGERRWRVGHDGSWAVSSPAVSGRTLYSGTSDGRFLHAVDVETGTEIWRLVGEGYTWSSPCVAGSLVYIGDGGGWIRAVDRETGLERWKFGPGDGVYSSPVVSDGVLFFGTEDGSVFAVHGKGDYPDRAVFWDEDYRDHSFFQQHLETRVYFEQRGYRVLDERELAAFLEIHVADRVPSVVVFAMDHLPSSVATEPSDTVLFRRYLDHGGKVVWPGMPPMFLARDSAGRAVAIDRQGPESLLGVDHSEANFDFYASMPTDLGLAWGLKAGWVSTYAVGPADVIQPLALDENGRAGAWVRSFDGPEGSGFVGMGLEHATVRDLRLLEIVAEYGIGTPRR